MNNLSKKEVIINSLNENEVVAFVEYNNDKGTYSVSIKGKATQCYRYENEYMPDEFDFMCFMHNSHVKTIYVDIFVAKYRKSTFSNILEICDIMNLELIITKLLSWGEQKNELCC